MSKVGSKKKNEKLGMNYSTASHRLVRDILFKFIVDAGITCYRCGKDLTRETFSIEHKEAWLNSEDPVGLFFDLDNISFSHQSCNYGNGTRYNKGNRAPHVSLTRYKVHKCRCDLCREANASNARRYRKDLD